MIYSADTTQVLQAMEKREDSDFDVAIRLIREARGKYKGSWQSWARALQSEAYMETYIGMGCSGSASVRFGQK